jgi:hypothetical protein
VVEGARLESVYIRKGIEGSNPSLSAVGFMKIATVAAFDVFRTRGGKIGGKRYA